MSRSFGPGPVPLIRLHPVKPPTETVYAWSLSSLKAKTKERNRHYELAAIETLEELASFSLAGRSFHTSSKDRQVSAGVRPPKYGVMCGKKEEVELDNLMKNIDEWGMDMHRVASLSNGHPLVVVMYTIFKRRDFFKFLHIDELTFLNCMLHLEDQYQKTPTYHNAKHAADVVQTVHVILNGAVLQEQCEFTDLETVAALFAAAVHDVGHPGQNNLFFEKTKDELYTRYNDKACLENLSLAITFETLRNPNFDIFANLHRGARASLRKQVIDMIITTDMTRHSDLLHQLDELLELKRTCTKAGFQLADYTQRIRVLQCVLHCADLSNPTKPLELYQIWANSVMDEFFAQGDKEREKDLPISTLCDRKTVYPEKSQIGFISFLVIPQYEKWAEFVRPDADKALGQLKSNLKWYEEEVKRVMSEEFTKL